MPRKSHVIPVMWLKTCASKSLSIETSARPDDTVTVVCLPMCTWLDIRWLITYWCAPDTDQLLTNARITDSTRYDCLLGYVLMIDKMLTVILGLVITYLPITKLITDWSTRLLIGVPVVFKLESLLKLSPMLNLIYSWTYLVLCPLLSVRLRKRGPVLGSTPDLSSGVIPGMTSKLNDCAITINSQVWQIRKVSHRVVSPTPQWEFSLFMEPKGRNQ